MRRDRAGRPRTIFFVTHDLTEAVTLADRVVVRSAHPATIKRIQTIDLPRPRDAFRTQFSDRFRDLCEGLWEAIQDDVRGTSGSHR